MKYVLMFARNDDEFLGSLEEAQRYEKVNAWFGELGEQGKMLGGEELQPARSATTVRWKGDDAVVTDGPFVESKETIAGFAVVDAADLDEAIAIAKKWPLHGHALEIRPTVTHDDH